MAVVWALACSLIAVLLGPLWVARRAALPGPRIEPVDYRQIVADEALWVSTAQLRCTGTAHGAIAEAVVEPGRTASVHPYEANIGARALVAAGPEYFPMVRDYLGWYLRHLNRPDRYGVAGTVYDYDVDPAGCTGFPQPHPVTGERPKYDSSDAYAGTFLSLVAVYARANPADHGYLRSPAVRADLGLVAGAVLATRGPSGLTRATPAHHAEYLMDNVEAQRGLADYAWLLRAVLGDPVGARQRAAEAAAIGRAVERTLWRDSRTPGMYGWAADRRTPSWAVWFPDGLAQLWPVMNGLGARSRRAALWSSFARRWPGWTRSTPAYGVVAVEHEPNAAVAYAAAQMGDRAAVDDYLATSQRHWAGRPPPWTVDDAGFRALAAHTMAITRPTR